MVFHEGDEGGDDEGEAWEDESRELVAEGFSSAGWHEDKRVVFCEDGIDDLLLHWAEACVAEVFFEDGFHSDFVWRRKAGFVAGFERIDIILS